MNKNRDVAFAIFKRETLSDQIVNQAINIGDLANRLESKFKYISVRRNFRKSMRIINLANQDTNDGDGMNLVFNDWLHSTCIDFILSDAEFLLILDGSISLGANFESWLLKLTFDLPSSIQALSLCPVESDSNEIVSKAIEPIKTSLRVNQLGFIFTRQAAQKYIKTFDQSPSSDFTNLIRQSKITCCTLLEDSLNQPFYFLDILGSQNEYTNIYKDTKVEENLIQEKVFFQRESKIPKIEAFISHWFSTWDNIFEIEQACRGFGYETTVMNTTILEKPGWANSTPISFFRQFEFACKNFNLESDYLLFITADVKTDKWNEFFEYADRVLRLENVGTFSPTLTAATTDQGWQVPFLYFHNESTSKICFRNDIIVTYINRKVIEDFRNFLDYFNAHQATFNPVVGWGPDQIIRVSMYWLNLFSVRDRTFTFMHPWSNSYDTSVARIEMEKISKIAEEYFLGKNLASISEVENSIMRSANSDSYKALVDQIDRLEVTDL